MAAGTQSEQVLAHGLTTLGVGLDVMDFKPNRTCAPRGATTPAVAAEYLLFLGLSSVTAVWTEPGSLVLVMGFEVVDEVGEEHRSILESGRRELF